MEKRGASDLVQIGGDYLETLRRCNGFYQCPVDPNNERRLGPLVGYAGKYTAEDGSQKQWVGDVYVNFAKAEEYPFVLRYFAKQMKRSLGLVLSQIDVFCGAPLGGYSFSEMLGLVFDRRAIKAEKKVTALATAGAREQSAIGFNRHRPEKKEKVAIVEDVCNNFSTTKILIDSIEECGAHVVAIVCLLNRSPSVGGQYDGVPVFSLIRLVIPEYQQDDIMVASDIADGNIVWKPKDEWPRLMMAMKLP